MIHIVNYGMGNTGSIKNMIKRLGYNSTITSDPKELKEARKIILPGVGAFDPAIKRIEELGLREILNECVLERKIPVLGICLGMQLITLGSEEGKLPGLGWIDAYAKKFPKDKVHKVPHMGWNNVSPSSRSPLTRDISNDCRFYFVHSYHVLAQRKEDSILKCMHGIEFDAAISKDNVFGVQFHPEKSHRYGKNLLNNFIDLC